MTIGEKEQSTKHAKQNHIKYNKVKLKTDQHESNRKLEVISCAPER